MPEPTETIGQRLKRIRTSRQISLDKAAEATRVRAHYLQALEADNYSVMSSAAQSRGFLRLYADYLGLDLEAAMQELSAADSVDAPPAASAPLEATPPPAPVTGPTPPASPADGRPARRPFWARLLRRSVPEEPAAEPASAPEPESVQESAPEPVLDESPAPVLVPTESAPRRARKPAAKKKPASAAKTSKPKTTKPKAAAKSAAKSGDKKKVSMKRQLKKRR